MTNSAYDYAKAETMRAIWSDCFGADGKLACGVELLEVTILNTKQIAAAYLLRSDGNKRRLTWKEAKQLGYDIVEVMA